MDHKQLMDEYLEEFRKEFAESMKKFGAFKLPIIGVTDPLVITLPNPPPGGYQYKVYRYGLQINIVVGDRVASKGNPKAKGVVTEIKMLQRAVVKWDDPSYGVTEEDMYGLILENPVKNVTTPPSPPKCDCGAHAVGSNSHSSWCTLGDLTITI